MGMLLLLVDVVDATVELSDIVSFVIDPISGLGLGLLLLSVLLFI